MVSENPRSGRVTSVRQAAAGQARFEGPALEGLVELYESWKKPGEAAKYRALSAASKESKEKVSG